MSTNVTQTNGNILLTISDGDIDTSTSLSLLGRNYAGGVNNSYADEIASNFVKLLENFAKVTAPLAPLNGQVWYDTTAKVLKIWNAASSVWKVIGSANIGAVAPTGPATGDMWFNESTKQLNTYDGSSWIVIGPDTPAQFSTSGLIITSITDTGAAAHSVLKHFIDGTLIAIHSKDAEFQPASSIPGYTGNVKPGINLTSNVALYGTVSNADKLDNLDSTDFLRANTSASTSGVLTFLTDSGFKLGAGQDLEITVTNGIDVNIRNASTSGNVKTIVTVPNVGNVTAMTVLGSSGLITVSANPTTGLGVATKDYVDTATGGGNGALLRTGSLSVLGNLAVDAANTNVYNLGSTTQRFNGIFANLFTGNITGTTVSMTGTGLFNGNVSGGNLISNASITGTTLTINGSSSMQTILPQTNNTYTLGNTTLRMSSVWSTTHEGTTYNGTTFNGTTFNGNLAGSTVVVTSLTGNLLTAAQPNVTSLGTLTSLSVSGNVAAGGMTIGGATVLTSGNYNLFSPSLTGANASGVWGIAVTGSAGQVDGIEGASLLRSDATDVRDAGLITEFHNTVSQTFNAQTGNLNLLVYNATSGADAFLTFNVQSDYAGYFGLGGAENDLVWGGWSVGNVRHRILHIGNYETYVARIDGSNATGIWPISISGSSTGNISGNINGATFTGDVTLNNGVDFNLGSGVTSNVFLGAAGATWGIYDNGSGNYKLKAVYNGNLTLSEDSKNVVVTGSRLFNDSGQRFVYANAGVWDISVSGTAVGVTQTLNDDDASYSLLFGSGTSVRKTANVFVNPFSDVITATGGFVGTASAAKYADLAEIYDADGEYDAGTVVVYGGSKEITQSASQWDLRVAGVISSKPGFLMNKDGPGLAVALRGRVPCKVTGKVTKGCLLATSEIAGVAMASDYIGGAIIGKSLNDADFGDEVGLIEIAVGLG